MAFPDHHLFSEREEAEIDAEAERYSLLPVTTEKDWVRLTNPKLKSQTVELPVHAVFEAEDRLAALIKGALDSAISPNVRGA